jgi:hypothetical protein
MTVVSFDALLKAAVARNRRGLTDPPEGVRLKLWYALLDAAAVRFAPANPFNAVDDDEMDDWPKPV